MSVLIMGAVDFGEDGVPPRTTVQRSRRRMVRTQDAYSLDGALWDFGKQRGFFHVFQTQDRQGILSVAQRVMLEDMFDAGAPFVVQTDLFQADDQIETFTATFDYENPPTYSTRYPSGIYWDFQIPLYLAPQED